MPREQIPDDAHFSPDTSSIESTSNENLPSARSNSSSEDFFIAADPYPEQIFSRQSSIRLAQMMPQRYQYEPKFDELLRQVSGSTNLATLTEIHLRVMSTMVGLHRINIFLPALVSLNLDGSSLNSLRDLGCGLAIKYLNVSRCGLRSFDGVAGLAMIEHLTADCNQIRDVNQLSTLPNLNRLSLRRNSIQNLGAVSFLSFCPRLNDLDLSNNPISQIADYRLCIKETLPGLLILDGRGMPHCVEPVVQSNAVAGAGPVSSSEFSSSFSSSSKHDDTISDHSNELIIESRPGVANDTVERASSSCENNMSHIAYDANRRPSTSESYQRRNSLSSGAPICGNVIAKVRRRKRSTAWTSSRSSLESTNAGDVTMMSNNSDDFPVVLPQKTVELELGILPPIAGRSTGAGSQATAYDSMEIEKLLVEAEKWRTCSQTSRTLRSNENELNPN